VRRAVDVSEPRLGLILLGVSLGALPAMIVTGRILDRVGPRIVPLTAGAFAVAGALPALARSPWALFALLLVVGAATGAFDVAINARANAIEAAADVRVMDGLHAAFSAGVVVGGISAGLARRAGADPKEILLVVCVVLVAVAAVNWTSAVLPAQESASAPLAGELLIVGAILALAFVLESGVESWSALFIENELGSSPAVSGLGPGMFAAAMVTGRLLAQRTPRTPAAARMAFAGTAAAVGLAVVALAHGPLLALAGFVVTGLGLAVSAPTLFRVAGRLGAAPAISTVAVLGYLGFVVGPPLFGAVAGASSVRGGFVFLCAAAGVLVTTAPILRRREIEYSR
jgi:hypothetical protein